MDGIEADDGGTAIAEKGNGERRRRRKIQERRVTRNRSESSTALKCHARISSARATHRRAVAAASADKKVMAAHAKVLDRTPEIIFNRRRRPCISAVAGEKASLEGQADVYSVATYTCIRSGYRETLTR